MTQFGNAKDVRHLVQYALAMLRPPLKLLPSEWAEQNVEIPAGDALPGKVRFANAPY